MKKQTVVKKAAVQKTYNQREFALAAGFHPSSLNRYFKSGKLDQKIDYTQQELDAFLLILKDQGGKKKRSASIKYKFDEEIIKQTSDPSFDPFELVEYIDHQAIRRQLIDKLVYKLREMKPKDARKVPALLFKTESATRKYCTDAKNELMLEKEFKDTAWSIKAQQNEDGEYTHHLIIRLY